MVQRRINAISFAIIAASLVLTILLTSCSRRTDPIRETAIPVGGTPTAEIQAASSVTPEAAKYTVVATPVPSHSPSPIEKTSPFMGIQVHTMAQETQKARFKESGAYWSRSDYMHWDAIEPQDSDPKDYQWDMVNEADLLAARANGGETIANILFTPTWARKYPESACGPVSQAALDDFAKFMGELVRRYSKAPYQVKYWEIGNEPDIDRSLVAGDSFYGCWGEIGDPYYGGRYYAEMLKVVYPAIKAVDKNAKVIVGSLVLDCDPINPPETEPGSGEFRDCTPSKFLEGILEAGGGDYFDGVGFHAYDYYYGQPGSYGSAGWHSASDTTGPVLVAKARYLKSLLRRYGYPDKELMNTELAVLCGKSGNEDYCQGEDFMNTKAYYIAQASAAALTEGLRANIWYSLTGWRGSALVDRNGAPNAAFKAFKFATSIFDKAIYDGKVEGFDGVLGYKFFVDNRAFWLVWSLDGNEHNLSLAKKPAAILDVYGKSLDGNLEGSELKVSVAPLYIQWDP